MSNTLFIHNALSNISTNELYLNRYIKFIKTFSSTGGKVKHHILPKAEFPQFVCLEQHSWNKSLLTDRQHFVAHWLLSKAVGGSQHYAFWLMMHQNSEKVTSKTYAEARRLFAETLANDKERSAKISKAFKGIPKSQEHIDKIRETKSDPTWKEKVGVQATQKRMENMDYKEVGRKGSQTKLDPEWRANNLAQWSKRVSEAKTGKLNPALSKTRNEKNNRPIVQVIREIAQKTETSLGRSWWAKSDEALQEILSDLESL